MTGAATDGGAVPDPSGPGSGPLADPVLEARRVIDTGRDRGLVVRVLGGVAVHMQAPECRPVLPRPLKDIDLVVARGDGKRLSQLLGELGYVGEEMFNTLRGSRRQLFHDPVNGRDLDAFVGEFSMCHPLPIAERLDHDAYTIPLAELLLTKLQIVELNERDERDIYTLCYHHHIGPGGIESDVVARVCAADWGLWRTCKGTVERCCADVGGYPLERAAQELIVTRLMQLWQDIDAAPKTGKWRRRSRVGERIRWYQEPEET